MAGDPEVSVVIPTHDATSTIGLQLEALSRQVDAPPFEVLVVDNRSSDRLVESVARWRDSIPGLRLVSANEYAGAGYARNVGARVARADSLLFCDADDLVAADWVRHGASALRQVDLACGSDITLDDGDFSAVSAIWQREFFRGSADENVQRVSRAASYPIVLGGNLAVRREVFEEIRGFDVSMRMGNEDNDFGVRAQLEEHLIHRAPAMRIAIRQRAGMRAQFRRARVAGRGHIQLCDRHRMRSASPHLNGNQWRLGPARAALAGARMLTRPPEDRDWPAVATRLGASIGLWEEDVRTHLRRRATGPLVGVGLRGIE